MRFKWIGPEGCLDWGRDEVNGTAIRSAVHERKGAVREIPTTCSDVRSGKVHNSVKRGDYDRFYLLSEVRGAYET